MTLRPSRFPPIISLLAVTIGACSSPSEPVFGIGDIKILTDRAQYSAGDSVFATITNEGANRLLYNTCPAELERQTGALWVTVGEAPGGFGDQGCDAVARWFDPGESVPFAGQLPAVLADGNYRIRFENFRDFDTGAPLPADRLASAPFEVRR